MKKFLVLVTLVFLLTGCSKSDAARVLTHTLTHASSQAPGKSTQTPVQTSNQVSTSKSYDVVLKFPISKYPETGKHIKDAIAHGEPDTCTIDRKDASEHRKESLAHVPKKRGFDRDEWPMAMCKEGGKGADVKYIHPKDNRGADAWISHRLEKYKDGTRVKFEVK
jgi:Deoxyribonuclease NucA/NucB